MDDQTERVVDLWSSYPAFLQNIQELRQITSTEEKEMRLLYQYMDGIWADGFIQTATHQGIRRWESVLKIQPYPGDSLKERRAAILLKWNQQLPYTLSRLRERLDAAVGASDYDLYVRYQEYILELHVYEQTYRVLQKVRDMTRNMIPANLIFILAGKYQVKIPIQSGTTSRLNLRSDFYARYNRRFLYLDGTWMLNGFYKLNGYRALQVMDLYPLQLEIRSILPVTKQADVVQCRMQSGVVWMAETKNTMFLGSGIPIQSDWQHQIQITGDMFLAPRTMTFLHMGCGVKISHGTETKISIFGQIPTGMGTQTQGTFLWKSSVPITTESQNVQKTTLKVQKKITATSRTCGRVSADTKLKSRSRYAAHVLSEPVAASRLTVEKDLWYLDGTYLLDGTKLLDAKIYEYDL